MRRRRTLLYAVLALAVPLPAFALGGGHGGSGGLGLSASLDRCGITGADIVCKIDASWSAVPGATRYTASVTSPDGSVTDYGSVGGSGTSFWVPYTGNGTYSVTVSAWGTPPGVEKPVVVAKQRAGTGTPAVTSSEGSGGAPTTTTGAGETDPAGGEPTTVETPSTPEPDPPVCESGVTSAAAADGTAATDATAGEAATTAPDGCPQPEPPPPTTTTTSTAPATTAPSPDAPSPAG